MKNMQGLFTHFTAQSTRILNFANDIKKFVDDTYAYFQQSFGFAPLAAPMLNLEKHTLAMDHAARNWQAVLPRSGERPRPTSISWSNKFYDSLVEEARRIFEATHADGAAWLKSALNPLNQQLKEQDAARQAHRT